MNINRIILALFALTLTLTAQAASVKLAWDASPDKYDDNAQRKYLNI